MPEEGSNENNKDKRMNEKTQNIEKKPEGSRGTLLYVHNK